MNKTKNTKQNKNKIGTKNIKKLTYQKQIYKNK